MSPAGSISASHDGNQVPDQSRGIQNAKVMMMNVGLFVLTPLRGARKYQFVPGEELGL